MTQAVTGAGPGWRLGQVGGVPVYIARSWLLIALVIVLLFGPVARDALPGSGPWAYAVAAAFAVLLLLSVLVHEAAHAVVAARSGHQVVRIVADFWGGHTAYQGAGSGPGRAALVAAAGPLANAALALLGWLLLPLLDNPVLVLLTLGLTFANGFVAVVNLLPGLPLDGGHVLDAVVWRLTGSRGLGTMVAAWSGRLLVVALALWVLAWPLLQGDRPSLTRLLWVGLLGFFLWAGSSQGLALGRARRALEGRSLQPLLRVLPVLDSSRPVSELDRHPAGSAESAGSAGHPAAVVTGPDGRPYGLVDAAAGALAGSDQDGPQAQEARTSSRVAS
ncbi:M50 family metallopeptidase, partial [Ornithinicoccus halotolerans]|uniref:M50 family metallopeptidase n=1 Tax=Ornithinicoccus halotolerans TaxID=1748220 RepID=UPI0012957754